MNEFLKVIIEIYGEAAVYEIIYNLPPLVSETIEMDLP